MLEPLPNDIFRIEVPAGQWTAMSVWHTASGGHIRGVFADEESGSLTAPPAGDILNPDAVACFLRLTHDRYYQHLKEFFGTTIISMFTDEPQVMGRNPLRPANPMPFTPGLIEWLPSAGARIRGPGCRRCGWITGRAPAHSAAASRRPSRSGWRRCSSLPSRAGAPRTASP